MLNHDRLKQSRSRASTGNQGWRPKDDENRIRVLPTRSEYLANWDKMDNIAIAYKLHYFRIEGRPAEVSLCYEYAGKGKCLACQTWRAYRKSTDPAMKQMAKDVGPADTYLMNILDLNNIQAGIQHWPSNYTCWDKILEVASNPLYGNVLDPDNGVNFIITKTPQNKSRTGYAQYSVLPEPQRTTVRAILDTMPGWETTLDSLEAQKVALKAESEIATLLTELGFPPVGTVAHGATIQPAPAQPAFAAPQPVAAAPAYAAPQPVAAPVAAPVVQQVTVQPAVPVQQAVPVQPAPVQPVPVQPAVAAAAPATVTPSPGAAAPAQAVAGPHYDPGPTYVEKTPVHERPVGSPRCFGDYAPQLHACARCPFATDCQFKMLGVKI